MNTTTARIIGATAAIAAVVGVAMIQLGMEPRLVLVGFVVMVVLAVVLLVGDLAVVAQPVQWHNYGDAADGSARPDRRVQLLRARLRQPARRRRASGNTPFERSAPQDEIGDALVAILDDHLLAEHGVDRSTDAAGAAALLGPELTRFVSDASARRSMTQRRSLASTIAAIERVVFSTPHDLTPPPTSRNP